MHVGEELAPAIELASQKLVECLLNDGKILICGNGFSAAIAQMFTSALIDRYEKERPSLPAIWLAGNIPTYTSIATEASFSEVYSKPLSALGKEGDILVTISTSGNSTNLVRAVSAAQSRNIDILAITGRGGGDISNLLSINDMELCTQVSSRSRIHEIHLLIINCLCDLIDHQLFGIE